MNIYGIINSIIRRNYPLGYIHSAMDFIENGKRAMDGMGKAIIDMFAMDEVDNQYIIEKEREAEILENKRAAYKLEWISFFDYGLDLLGVSH